MHTLCEQLQNRVQDRYFGSFVSIAFSDIHADSDRKRKLSENFVQFLETALDYLKKWFDLSEENPLRAMGFLALVQEISFNDISVLVCKLNLQ